MAEGGGEGLPLIANPQHLEIVAGVPLGDTQAGPRTGGDAPELRQVRHPGPHELARVDEPFEDLLAA